MNDRTSLIARVAGAVATATILVMSVASSAWAHTGFDLDEAAPGTIVALDLTVANESSTAGTTIVELRFPEPIVVVELPAIGDWTAAPVDGEVGAPAIGVVWSRPAGDPGENPNLPLVIGPLPATEGRLQFKVIQSYGDGRIDRWIEEWPVGGPEPQQPGPVLDLVAGAPGTIVETTVAPTTDPATTALATTSAPATTTASATTAPATTTEPATAAPATAATPVAPATDLAPATSEPTSAAPTETSGTGVDDGVGADVDEGSSSGVVTAIGIVIVLVAVAAGILLARRRQRR